MVEVIQLLVELKFGDEDGEVAMVGKRDVVLEEQKKLPIRDFLALIYTSKPRIAAT